MCVTTLLALGHLLLARARATRFARPCASGSGRHSCSIARSARAGAPARHIGLSRWWVVSRVITLHVTQKSRSHQSDARSSMHCHAAFGRSWPCPGRPSGGRLSLSRGPTPGRRWGTTLEQTRRPMPLKLWSSPPACVCRLFAELHCLATHSLRDRHVPASWPTLP